MTFAGFERRFSNVSIRWHNDFAGRLLRGCGPSGKQAGVMTIQTMCFIFGALLLAVGILGGGFEVKEIKVSNVTTTARIAATIVGIVFVGLGFWQTGALPLPAATSAGTSTAVTMEMSPREEDTDRWGSDFSSFAVSVGHTETCEDACKTTGECLAWTYVKPNVQGPQAICYLKRMAAVARRNECCVSGVKVRK
jgi:hypothetical protein